MRKVLPRGSFLSVADLQAKVLAFIEYYSVSPPVRQAATPAVPFLRQRRD